MRSRVGWTWVEHELETWPGEGALTAPCWRALVPGLRYVDGAPVTIEVAWWASRWWSVIAAVASRHRERKRASKAS